MAREFFQDTVGLVENDAAGKPVFRPLSNVQIFVYAQGTLTTVPIYTSRIGTVQKSNPFITSSTGTVEFWADPGEYDIFFNDTEAPDRITEKTIGWTAVEPEWDLAGFFADRPSASVAGRRYFSTDTGISYFDTGSVWIGTLPPDFGITTGKLADLSVTTNKLADNAVTADKLPDTLFSQLGISQAGTVRRGKCIIPGEDTRTNTVYGLMTTPDVVPDVVLDTDGIIFVIYRAMWKESIADTARAGLFLNAIQQVATGDSYFTPAECHASTGAGANVNLYTPLMSSPVGLVGTPTLGLGYVSDVTTGQALAHSQTTRYRLNGDTVARVGSGTTDLMSGVLVMHADAGTYNVSVQFRSASGSVTVKERKLLVWTQGFENAV